MPYKTISDLPPGVKDSLPAHAAEIYMAAHNAAMTEYKGDEAKAAAVAWAAVKKAYKKNDKDKWVAKESKKGASMKGDLQAKYAEIIQEADRRNKTDDKKVKAFITETSTLLADEKPQDAKLTASVKEADVILVWLKEQAVYKTEDGVKFPAEAYAYVPDKEKPSEWKLRLWESPTLKVTRKQLGVAAAALSPGGFRGQKVDIPSSDLAGVKRTIRAEYRKLDVPDEEIPRWVKEGKEVRDYVRESIEIPLAEVTAENIAKGILPVRILQKGFNSSKGRYYTENAVADCKRVFEGAKQFANHATKTEEKERPERDIRDWVSTLDNIRPGKDGTALGEAHIHAGWFKDMVQGLYEAGTLNKLGVSINTIGKGIRQKIEGIDTLVVESLIDHPFKSVDFVTEAGAGGQAGVRESVAPSILDVYLVDLAKLKESRPDLVKEVEADIRESMKQEVKHKMELEDKVKELETNIATVTTERDELKTKITEAEKATKIAAAKSKIDEAISKSELPEAAKVKLTERFAGAESDKGVAEAITAEKEYIAKITEAGKVKGMGKTEPDLKAAKEALKESFKRLGMTDAQAEEAARR